MDRPAIDILPLTPERAKDFFAFFDGEAFADNPSWRSCYCNFCHFDHACGGWALADAEGNRRATTTRIAAGQMKGHIAYAEGRPVGWVNAAPNALYPLGNLPPPDAYSNRTGQILCFVVAPAWRGKGVARALLEAACQGLKSQGMTIAEANPRGEAETPAENHFGPLALYLSAGFTQHAIDEGDGSIFVRRAL